MTTKTEQITEFRRLAAEATENSQNAQAELFEVVHKVGTLSSQLDLDEKNVELHKEFAEAIGKGNSLAGVRDKNQYLTRTYEKLANSLENEVE